MKKRVFCLLLSLVFCLSLMPISVAAGDITQIQSISVSVERPQDGQFPDSNPAFQSKPAGALDGVEAVMWYYSPADSYTGTDADVWTLMTSSDFFSYGNYYLCQIYLTAKAGYAFTTDTTGTVNKAPHNDEFGDIYENESTAFLCGIFKLTKEVTEFNVSVPAPVVGGTPKIPTGITTYPKNAASIEDYIWLYIPTEYYTGSEYDSWAAMSLDWYFETGYTYAFGVLMSTSEGFTVAPDVASSINGQPHDESFGGPVVSQTRGQAFYVFPSLAEVGDVNYFITEPAVGDVPDYTPTVEPSDSVTIIFLMWLELTPEEYENLDLEGNESVGTFMTNEDTFKEGYYYAVSIIATPNEGVTIETPPTINGKKPLEVAEDGVSVAQLFGPLKAAAETETLNVTVTPPALGAVPAKTAQFTPNKVAEYTIVWYKTPEEYYGTENTSWAEMTAGETFAPGYYFGVSVTGKFADGFGVLLNDITLNNEDPFYVSVDERGYFEIDFDFKPLKEDDTLDIVLDEPQLGAYPDTSPEFAPDKVTVTDMQWYKIPVEEYGPEGSNEWKKMSSEDGFMPGYMYGFEIDGRFDEGFAPDKNHITINGKKPASVYAGDGSFMVIGYYGPFENDDALDVLLDEPVIGANPDMTPEFTPDKATVTYFQWFKIAAEDYDPNGENQWTKMAADEVFEPGYYYGFEIDATLDEGFCPSDGKITLNGKLPERVAADGYMVLIQTYGPLTEPVNPPTGDTNLAFVWASLAAIALGAMAAVALGKKRRA